MQHTELSVPFNRKGPQTLRDQIVEVLRHAIITGILRDGEELNQVAIAQEFGTSRIPVREALRQLESEGLIESRPYYQALVTQLSPQRLEELFEVRIALECLALRKAVPQLNADDISQLEQLLGAMERETNHDRWLEGNRDFHLTLSRASGMTMLCDFILRVRNHVDRYLNRLRVHRSKEADHEHRVLLDLCKQRDLAAAEQQLENHIRGTLASLQARLNSNRRSDKVLQVDIPGMPPQAEQG